MSFERVMAPIRLLTVLLKSFSPYQTAVASSSLMPPEGAQVGSLLCTEQLEEGIPVESQKIPAQKEPQPSQQDFPPITKPKKRDASTADIKVRVGNSCVQKPKTPQKVTLSLNFAGRS